MSEWLELGVMTTGLETGRNPVVARVSKNVETGQLSYEFGILSSGKVRLQRYWREDRLYKLATLAKAAASMSLASMLLGKEISVESFERAVERSGGALQLVDSWMSGEQEKAAKKGKRFGATIGEMVGRKS